MEINRSEVYRYMGGSKMQHSSEISTQVEIVCERMESLAEPRYVYKVFTPEITDSGIIIGENNFKSETLKKHLFGAEKVAVLAATLGTSADIVIRENAVLGTVKLSAAQAAGAAMLEQVLDDAVKVIEKEEKLFATPRFSAGYGDLALEYQEEILMLCDATRRIGITLTENMMMIPTKSVTAFVGLRSEPCSIGGCKECSKKDCDFRK